MAREALTRLAVGVVLAGLVLVATPGEQQGGRTAVVVGAGTGHPDTAHPGTAHPAALSADPLPPEPRHGRPAGPISRAGAVGVLPRPEDLGTLHVDPLPPGASLAAPTDTRSVLRRADTRGRSATATLDGHVTPSCSGTGTDGPRVQVLYLYAAGTTSRLPDVRPVVAGEAANVDDVFALSARQTGGERRVRWVHDARCRPVIEPVAVPEAALGHDFFATIRALQAQGLTATDRKYLAFADTNALCGIGTYYDDASPTRNPNDGRYASYARVDVNCWSTGHSVPAHELTHTLGGVLSGAPHATPSGHCHDESDLMCYDDGSGTAMTQVCPAAQEQLLDCGHNDYFSTAPEPGTYLGTHWNAAGSSFLDTVVVAPLPAVTSWSPVAHTGRRVTAVLRTVDGVAVAGRAVRLLVRWRDSATWQPLTTTTTSWTGRASAWPTYDRAGWFRFEVVGDEEHLGSRSSWVLVRTRTAVRLGGPYGTRLTATLRTSLGTPVIGAGVVLQRRTLGVRRGSTARTAETGTGGRVVVRVAPSRTTYYRWRFPGDADHEPSRSGWVVLRR